MGLADSRDILERVVSTVEAGAATLALPRNKALARRCLLGLALLWIILALAELVWDLMPVDSLPAANQQGASSGDFHKLVERGPMDRHPVEINELAGWQLFGSPDAPTVESEADESAVQPGLAELVGAELDAEDTRLPLVLAGVVFSSDIAQARAMIEVDGTQGQYASGDELPLNGKVSVAKILADRVLLLNNGRYELLRLFDDSELVASSTPLGVEAEDPQAEQEEAARRQRRQQILQMADRHRQGSYNAPRSLAELVNVAAVRDNGDIVGFRLTASRNAAQFKALGFEQDDIVTAVNGMSLTESRNVPELYRVLQHERSASFDIDREGDAITVQVGLDSGLGQ